MKANIVKYFYKVVSAKETLLKKLYMQKMREILGEKKSARFSA
jgi:hypothetical protein